MFPVQVFNSSSDNHLKTPLSKLSLITAFNCFKSSGFFIMFASTVIALFMQISSFESNKFTSLV